jgi:hypothetical protein
MGRPLEGRSRSLRVYRLWTREEAVPHEGQEAVGETVRSVSAISSATSTSSTWTSGTSGKMMIQFNGCLEERESWKKCSTFSISHLDQQGCVRTKKLPFILRNIRTLCGFEFIELTYPDSTSARKNSNP